MSLELYKTLGDNDPSVRIEAACFFSEQLHELLDGEVTAKSKEAVGYALSRLTKGLASGREAARPGFSVVLTELLSAINTPANQKKWDFPLEKLIGLVISNTTVPGHAAGPEEKDYYLGRLFGLQVLMGSGILFSSKDSLVQYDAVLKILFELSTRRPWLSEACAWTIFHAAPTWPKEIAEDAVNATYTALVKWGRAQSSEGVGIWLSLLVNYPKVSPPKGVWLKRNPLNPQNLETLAKVLKEVGGEEGGKGSWNPKVHFAWDIILRVYFGDAEASPAWKEFRNSKDIAEWDEFWRKTVDESLFLASSSDMRKQWGFQLFCKVLRDIPIRPVTKDLAVISPSSEKALAPIFSKNLMRCLINHLSDHSRFLNRFVHFVVTELLKKAEAVPCAIPTLIEQLISKNGTPNFDRLTKSDAVDVLIRLASKDEAVAIEVLRLFNRIILNPLKVVREEERDDETDLNQDQIKKAGSIRQWVADRILSMVRTRDSENAGFTSEVLRYFATLGYYESSSGIKVPKPAISVASRDIFRARLLSCLAYLMSKSARRNTKLAEASMEDTWPYKALMNIVGLEKEGEDFSPTTEFDETTREIVKSAIKTLGKIRKRKFLDPSGQGRQLASFELLYSLIIIQVYNGEVDALGVLEDLKITHDKLFRKNTPKEAEGEVDVSQVLFEIILSLLSKPSALLRKLAHEVFQSFLDDFTKEGLELAFAVLATKESLDGQQELYDDEDEEMDSDSEKEEEEEEEDENDGDNDVEDEEMEDDVGVVDLDEEEESDAISTNSESERLEAALATALKAPVGEESDSDADMTDSEMLALDETLCNIFKARGDLTITTTANTKPGMTKSQEKKKLANSAKRNVINFKLRVLGLLDQFVENQFSYHYNKETQESSSSNTKNNNPLPTDFFLPLIKSIPLTTAPEVHAKLFNLVRKISKSPPTLSASSSETSLLSLLALLHAESSKSATRGVHKSCMPASMYVMKTLVAKNPDNISAVADVYAESLKKWVLQKEPRKPGEGLFLAFINWASDMAGGPKGKADANGEASVSEKADQRMQTPNRTEIQPNQGGRRKRAERGIGMKATNEGKKNHENPKGKGSAKRMRMG